VRAVRRFLLRRGRRLLWAAPAQAFSKQTGTRTMSDGTSIAYDLHEPDRRAARRRLGRASSSARARRLEDDMDRRRGVVSHGFARLPTPHAGTDLGRRRRLAGPMT